jgi:hypothetical protein
MIEIALQKKKKNEKKKRKKKLKPEGSEYSGHSLSLCAYHFLFNYSVII